MFNSATDQTNNNKSLKDRLSFNWPTRPTSIKGKPTQVIAPFTETKLPVKQRVVFPSDRLTSNNADNGQSSNYNQQSTHTSNDDAWDSMADVFRGPPSSPPNPWAVGSDKNTDSVKDNKRRRNDQNFKSSRDNNYNSRRNNNDGEFSGYVNNNNNNRNSNGKDNNNNDNRSKWSNKKRSSDWDWDPWKSADDDHRKRKICDNNNDRAVIDWSVNSNSSIDPSKLVKKSIATQTDFSTTRTIGIQTDSTDYYIPLQRNHFYCPPELPYNQFNTTISSQQMNMSSIHKDTELTNGTDKNYQQPGGSSITSCSMEETSKSLHRDPRVARRARNMNQN